MLLTKRLHLPRGHINIRVLPIQQTPRMERYVTLPHRTLHTGPRLLQPANRTFERPPRRGHLAVVNQFQPFRVGEMDVGQPQPTLDMCPVAVGGGLEGPPGVTTEGAFDLAWVEAVFTEAAEPFPLRDEGHAVAALVDGQVAMVAKDNLVVVFAVPFPADGADDFFLLMGRMCVCVCMCMCRSEYVRGRESWGGERRMVVQVHACRWMYIY